MRALLQFLTLLAALVLAYLLGQRYFVRLDLTAEKRYTLSAGTEKLLAQLPQAVYVTVYLEGDFPYPIQRYRQAVATLLAEMRARAPKPLNFTFVNPAKNPQLLADFKQRGIQPIPINVRVSQTETRRQYMYPIAVVQSGQREVWVDLVKGNLYPTGEINLLEAEQEVEYKLAAALRQIVVFNEKPLLGLLEGHGEYRLEQMPQLRAELERFYRLLPVRVREGQALAPAKATYPIASRNGSPAMATLPSSSSDPIALSPSERSMSWSSTFCEVGDCCGFWTTTASTSPKAPPSPSCASST